MIKLKPFRALRPKREWAKEVSSPPYDVINEQQAQTIKNKYPHSFLGVIKPEAVSKDESRTSENDLLQKARKKLQALMQQGIMFQDEQECFYIYRQNMGDFDQIGIVGLLSVDDYEKGLIKRHEHIKEKPWQNRVKHILTTRAHTGCAFTVYRRNQKIDAIVRHWIEKREPIYEFVADDGVQNQCWKISDQVELSELKHAFEKIQCLYIADGHHRIAAAAEVARLERDEAKINDQHNGEYAFFPAVIVPEQQIHILGYYRLIRDWNGYTPNSLLQELKKNFRIEKIASKEPYYPGKKYEFGMYLDGKWFRINLREGLLRKEMNSIMQLDVSILHHFILEPFFYF